MGSLEKAARAAKAEIGRQLSARPLLGNAESGDWHATGDVQEIDLTLVARAVLLAVLPTLDRWDVDGEGEEFRYADDPEFFDGTWVRYSDLTAILQEMGDG